MNTHPINLGLRFLLELTALVAMGYWGWQRGGEGIIRFILAIAIPIIAAILWGTFRVPGDPGDALVAVPGIVRLLFELIFFGFATWGFYNAGLVKVSWIFSIIILIHYFISYDRVLWLIKQ